MNIKLIESENGIALNGIIWLSETENLDISLFKNYKNALNNYTKQNLTEVNDISQLSNLKNIFVIDEHFLAHKEFILNRNFIKLINKFKIKIIIFNTEKIYNQAFKRNVRIQKELSAFENIVQFLSDAQDIKKIGSFFPTKQLFSKNFNFEIYKNSSKIKELLFIGQVDGVAYESRRKVLSKVEKYVDIPLRIQKTTRNFTYDEYLSQIARYKFILNPLGNSRSRFVNIRFYEALGLNSIPVQEYTKDMLKHYKELNYNNVIKFKKIKDLKKVSFNKLKINPTNSISSDTLEQYFSDNKLNQFIKI